MLSFIKTLLQAAAWPIQAPEPYSAFHILLCAAGIPLAVFLARRLARICLHPRGVLFICGLVLAVSELYKQSFLYFIVSQGRYNWWYFPFQLCSVPMYLCLILPLFRHPSHRSGRKSAYAPSCRILPFWEASWHWRNPAASCIPICF